VFFAELMKKPAKDRGPISFVKVDTVRALQDLFSAVDEFREVFWNSGFVTYGLDSKDLRYWIIVDLLKESLALVQIILHLSCKIRGIVPFFLFVCLFLC